MRFTKPFSGCRTGEVYPTQFKPGDECPAELEAVAKTLDILASDAEWQRRLKKEQAEDAKRREAEAVEARVTKLRALAAEHQLDLGEAKTAEDIEAALKAANVAIPA